MMSSIFSSSSVLSLVSYAWTISTLINYTFIHFIAWIYLFIIFIITTIFYDDEYSWSVLAIEFKIKMITLHTDRQASQFIMNINIWIYACVLRQGNKRSVIIFISHIQRCVCVWNFFCSTRTTCQVWKKYLCKNIVQDARR